jgi:hypothetical protein
MLMVGLVVTAAAGFWFLWTDTHSNVSKGWNSTAIRATYVGAQLRETDPGHASLVLTYELSNATDSDYRLADDPNFVVMSRLKSDRSLSSQEDMRLSYPTFLPARQRARVALEIRHTFVWPGDGDAALQNKLKEFVNQRLSDVDEFVLFDSADRYQIEFPSAWQELKLASAAGY